MNVGRNQKITRDCEVYFAFMNLVFFAFPSNYAFPTGSVYGFGIKRRRRQRRTPTISESARNIKILHIVNKAGLFHKSCGHGAGRTAG